MSACLSSAEAIHRLEGPVVAGESAIVQTVAFRREFKKG